MINPNQDTLFVGLRAFVLSLIPTVEVIQGLGNGVPTPEGEFIAITPSGQTRLATNESKYNVPPAGAGTRDVLQRTQYAIQIDCYGANASDHATTICAMFRDAYACDFLSTYQCQPLFSTDPTQSALVTGEENYEQRWTLTAMLQFNPVVTVSQEFADELNNTFVNAFVTTPL